MIGNVFLTGVTRRRREFGLPRGTRFVLCIGHSFGTSKAESHAANAYADLLGITTGYAGFAAWGSKPVPAGLVPVNSSLYRWAVS